MNLSQLVDDEKIYLSRLNDLFSISRDKYKTKFSSFLNERQTAIALEFIKQNRLDNYMLYGGRENASRLVLGTFAPYEEPHETSFPIVPVTASYPASAELTHRDFLGSLMALKIKRESIGDILISQGRCVFFVLEHVSHVVLDELFKVGNFGVKTAIGVPGDFVVLERFETMRGTISSARIDSLVSMITNLSREKSAGLISDGRVQRNFAEIASGSKAFELGDTISIRGYGKYIVDEIALPTRKGRLPVIYRKYI